MKVRLEVTKAVGASTKGIYWVDDNVSFGAACETCG